MFSLVHEVISAFVLKACRGGFCQGTNTSTVWSYASLCLLQLELYRTDSGEALIFLSNCRQDKCTSEDIRYFMRMFSSFWLKLTPGRTFFSPFLSPIWRSTLNICHPIPAERNFHCYFRQCPPTPFAAAGHFQLPSMPVFLRAHNYTQSPCHTVSDSLGQKRYISWMTEWSPGLYW